MPRASDHARNVTDEPYDPAERYLLYRLCDCTTCEGKGKDPADALTLTQGVDIRKAESLRRRCPDCRGEGRVRQELATCESPEAVGVALVTLGREGEWEGCAFGCLDRGGEVGEKWLVKMWLPSPRNVSDAGRVLARSKKPPTKSVH